MSKFGGVRVVCPDCGGTLLPGATKPSRVDEHGVRWFACGGSSPEPWGCFGAYLTSKGWLTDSEARRFNAKDE